MVTFALLCDLLKQSIPRLFHSPNLPRSPISWLGLIRFPNLINTLSHYSQSRRGRVFVSPVFLDFDPGFEEDFVAQHQFNITTGHGANFLEHGSLPMMMPFWLSRSTIIVARIWTLSVNSSRFMDSMTTATECGISSRVRCRTFSRIISDTKKRSGWSVIWSAGKYWKPSSRFSLRISMRRLTLFLG